MSTNSNTFPGLAASYAAGKHYRQVLFLIVLMCISSFTLADSEDDYRCGTLTSPGQYGPYDYRTATKDQKFLVEGAHFTSEVEHLKRGTGGGRPGPDIDYTLRAFPNHPRALKAMMDLGIRDKTNRPYGSHWTVDCYFNRAVRFTPDDSQVRMILGIFLLRNGDKKGAVEQLEVARTLGVSGGNLSYNLGLAYFQVQDYEKAREYAYKARELGFDLKGLQNMLMRAGQWHEQDGVDKAPQPPEAGAENTQAPKN